MRNSPWLHSIVWIVLVEVVATKQCESLLCVQIHDCGIKRRDIWPLKTPKISKIPASCLCLKKFIMSAPAGFTPVCCMMPAGREIQLPSQKGRPTGVTWSGACNRRLASGRTRCRCSPVVCARIAWQRHTPRIACEKRSFIDHSVAHELVGAHTDGVCEDCWCRRAEGHERSWRVQRMDVAGSGRPYRAGPTAQRQDLFVHCAIDRGVTLRTHYILVAKVGCTGRSGR